MKLPKSVRTIIHRLSEKGYEAFAVGGCVRDSLMGRIPKDWDICTDALPGQVMEIFSDLTVIPTGLEHGTVTLLLDHIPYEVTTYRKDSEYLDGRRPSEVSFVSDIETDLSRRDFTINAIAYNEDRGFVDPFSGREDIGNKRIQTVGDSLLRFGEDYLRMMRAVRFSVVLDFTIEEDTEKAISALAEKIQKISAERIRQELIQIILSPQASTGIRTLEITGLLSYILPEVQACKDLHQNNPHHSKDVYGHTLEVLDLVKDASLEVKLAALFHDIGKTKTKTTDMEGIDHFYSHEVYSEEMARDILHRLKFSNEEIHSVTRLIRYHGYMPQDSKTAIKRFINKVGRDLVLDLLDLQKGDKTAHVNASDYEKQLNHLHAQIQEILSSQEPMEMKDLALDGRDILALGYREGRQIGAIKNRLLQHVIQHPEDNQREKLIPLIKEFAELED